MDAAKMTELKLFVEQCKKNPAVLSDPSISFFRDYLESLGAKLPPAAYSRGESPRTRDAKSQMVDDMDEDLDADDFSTKGSASVEHESDDEIVESDIELEGETVEPDNDPPQKMGDPSIEVTEESRDASQEAKGKAIEAISEGKLDEAIEHLTEAILLNPMSAIMYATRASVYIKMKKPNAAIRDANAALEINPDSAKGYKSRGIALAMLGKWEEAAKDLHLASKLDYDEEISAVLKKVEPNVHKIEEHHRKYERLRKEREEKKIERERQRRRAEAQAAYEKAKKKEQSSSRPSGGMPGGFPGGMPGGFPGAMPGGVPGNIDMGQILNDPELMASFNDPEVMAALQDVMNNPASFAKHQANPKVAPVIAKMMGKFAGSMKEEMSQGTKWIHHVKKLSTANIPTALIENGQNRVIDASLTLIRERAKLRGELLRALGGVKASASLLGVPLGHNSSFLQGPAFAPPRIREAIWCGSTNSSTEEGKELNDPRVLTDVGDVPIQEIRDCGVDDSRLMNVISESVKLVMEEVGIRSITSEGREQGKRFGVEQYEMRTFSKDRDILENLKLGEGAKGVYVSVDVDCLDPAFAPGVSHIEPGGLSFRDVLNILHNLQADVVAADVVEFNPQRDTVDGMTAMVAAKLVRELTAKISK
ncbi:putative FAM10 family protein [Cocos nucifera]|uniref:Putative FAM10 family protein n=5 Tax=commelinids TaxID=4734 RepID=A0A8K0IF76_COCNU|nr:putative FAM10 family protein [Cocos nucifera]